MTKYSNVSKYAFDLFCKELEKGIKLSFYTETHVQQEFYKEKLIEKYGDNLIIERYEIKNSYAYEYELKQY